MSKNYFGDKGLFVYVVDFPTYSDADHWQGVGKVLKQSLDMAGIKCKYKQLPFDDYFYDLLGGEFIKRFKKHKNLTPVLHIHTSQGGDGISLSGAEFLDWESFSKLLAPINEAVGNRLVLCLSNLEGFSEIEMMNAETGEGPPCRALVANDRPLDDIHATIGFTSFYHLLNIGHDLESAVYLMRQVTGYGGFRSLEVQGRRPLRLAS